MVLRYGLMMTVSIEELLAHQEDVQKEITVKRNPFVDTRFFGNRTHNLANSLPGVHPNTTALTFAGD